MMKSIVCEKPTLLKMQHINLPEKKAGHAIVKIRKIGICGTDLHAYEGNQPFFEYPRILGHELAGVIEEIEENQDGLQPGDQVTVIPYLECGTCIACRRGLTNCCTSMKVLGVHVDGGMCEKLSVPYDHLLKTNQLTLDQTVIIEPLSIGAHAVRRADIHAGEVVLVIGAGPIGVGVMAFAKQKGAKVIAMDIEDERLNFARKWADVDEAINAKIAPIEQLMEITNGDMPTVVFDATGNRTSMMEAFQYVANGGKLVYVGLVKSDITFSDPLFHAKELSLLASRNATKEDFQTVIHAIENGFIDANLYITHRLSFENFISDFDKLKHEAGLVKAIVELS